MSDERNAKNAGRQGGVSSGILFSFYLNEVISDIFKLLTGRALNCSKVICADGLILVVPTAHIQEETTIQSH